MPVQSETNKPELLAPAGGWEQLEYALHFGADAVYLACDRFGLRARASNFSLEDLPRAVALAHGAGARVYVTCNAYAHDEDLAALPEYAQAMEAAGVDAAIVSDFGRYVGGAAACALGCHPCFHASFGFKRRSCAYVVSPWCLPRGVRSRDVGGGNRRYA